MWLIAFILAVPLIEIALFVTVGGWLTLLPTLAIVLGTGVLGVIILRLQGLQAMADMQAALRNMQSPVSPLAHGGLIMAAGILLILPGFLTDTLGILLLIPLVRRGVIAGIAGRIRGNSAAAKAADWRDAAHSRYDDEVIDAEFSEVERDRSALRGNSGWTQD